MLNLNSDNFPDSYNGKGSRKDMIKYIYVTSNKKYNKETDKSEVPHSLNSYSSYSPPTLSH